MKQNNFIPFFLVILSIYLIIFIDFFWLKIIISTILNLFLTHYYYTKVKKNHVQKNDIVKIILALLIPAIIASYFYFSI